jgi:hypothetical protein
VHFQVLAASCMIILVIWMVSSSLLIPYLAAAY